MEEEKTQTTGPKRALPKSLLISLLTVLAGLLIVLFLGGYLFGWSWTGFGAAKSLQAKTLWDWMQLLIIPAALAVGGLWFNVQQNERQRRLNEAQHTKDEELAEERRKADQKLAQDQQRENALQTYLDRMAELLLQGKLHESEEGAEMRQIARARTLTALRQLDKERKTALLRFLYEARLIGQDHNIISLSYANLSWANLSYANLSWADLSQADLNGANLFGADLSQADLSGADLSQADLSGADLSGANLNRANLSGAIITQDQWEKARSLSNVTLPDGIKTASKGQHWRI